MDPYMGVCDTGTRVIVGHLWGWGLCRNMEWWVVDVKGG